jgi:hypothetical protein
MSLGPFLLIVGKGHLFKHLSHEIRKSFYSKKKNRHQSPWPRTVQFAAKGKQLLPIQKAAYELCFLKASDLKHDPKQGKKPTIHKSKTPCEKL